MLDERRPHRPEVVEVLGDASALVAADERADDSDAQCLCGIHDLAQVSVGRLAPGGFGVEVVRVVRERRDPEAGALEGRVDRVGVEALDVDVADARVAPLLAAGRRPAGDLERLETLRRGPVGDLVEREVGERGGQQVPASRCHLHRHFYPVAFAVGK